ncbi:MAG: hypothetical protein HUK08_02860 [Bacteroidaceae bacterium]|nr:hypothetical protein [Bacteroidaceae bacterium]
MWLIFSGILTGLIFALIGVIVVTIAKMIGFDYADYDNVPFCFGLGFVYAMIKAFIDMLRGF